MHLHEISLSPETAFKIFGFPVTTTFIVTVLLSVSIFGVFSLGIRKKKVVPGFFQNAIEWALESLLNFIDSITGDRKRTEEVFPITATLFFLILTSNLLEILPGLGVFHFMRSPSSVLNFTLALSMTGVAYVNVLAVKNLGLFTYLKKFINLKNPMLAFVGVLEAVSELTKVLSLAMRLFGNLFAGETLLLVIYFLFAFAAPLPFLGLELLVSFIQAFIFSTLIVVFYTTSLELAH